MEEFKLILEILNKGLDIFKDIGLSKKQKYLYIKEEEMKIDCYEFLKQLTKTNTSLIPLRYISNYNIDNEDYFEDHIFEAKCVVNAFSSYEFSIASTTLKKYEEIECLGYDLVNNPNVKIRPKLVSPDSFSKRLSLQLNRMLNKNDILKIQIKYKSYGSMSGNKRYIMQSFNYKKIELSEYNISFNFTDRVPDNIRIYEINPFNNTYHFLYKIFPDSDNSTMFTDKHNEKNIKKHNKYIYVF